MSLSILKVEVQEKLIERFSSLLPAGGYFVTGCAEMISQPQRFGLEKKIRRLSKGAGSLARLKRRWGAARGRFESVGFPVTLHMLPMWTERVRNAPTISPEPVLYSAHRATSYPGDVLLI